MDETGEIRVYGFREFHRRGAEDAEKGGKIKDCIM